MSKRANQELVDFLLARLAADEQQVDIPIMHSRGECDVCDGARQAQQDEKRWSAEIVAKRELIDLAFGLTGKYAHEWFRLYAEGSRAILRSLALPYATHADYQEGWRP